MAVQKPIKKIKVRIEAGQATPKPPLGPALGQAGINISEFCQKFNAMTDKMEGELGVSILVFEDRSYDIKVKSPAVAGLLFKALGI
ncbi:MAG TPA: 50S ribosomal protein L11, partial [Candidatus Paceibacterota bacterium]|nr:50S ribosomal protein L11 [Candidatus Paceibacterota bacterium]